MLFNVMFWSCVALGVAVVFVAAFGLIYGQDEIVRWLNDRH